MPSYGRLDQHERSQLERDGFVVRERVFNAAEVRSIADSCEQLIQTLLKEKRHRKLNVGSYTFEMQRRLGTVVKWEQDNPAIVLGVELFAHFSDSLHKWALDPRLVQPCADVVGQENIALFTEKLNVKRAHKGGAIVLHQDFPYWRDVSPVANRNATALLFLDDANLENGCLEAAPGSHREGPPTNRDVEGFGQFEMDPARYEASRLIPVEVPAGSVIFFGPFLVHRSLPNRSDSDRRALLYSYQPAGYSHLRESLMPRPQ